ncbi:hypothetical protein FXW31_01570 [Candidatus Liberibacter asiaticus]|nr:hypothetical protein FXW31_01570 [Candidatus Liberibacter asiaticus]
MLERRGLALIAIKLTGQGILQTAHISTHSQHDDCSAVGSGYVQVITSKIPTISRPLLE